MKLDNATSNIKSWGACKQFIPQCLKDILIQGAVLTFVVMLLLSLYAYLLPVTAVYNFNPPLDHDAVFQGKVYNAHQIKYVMMDTIFKFCKEHDITIVLSEGGLLGAARDRSLLPWDHDLDFAIHPDHFQKIIDLKPELGKMGFECTLDARGTGFHLHAQGYHYPELELNRFESVKGCSFNEVGFMSLAHSKCVEDREEKTVDFPDTVGMKLKDKFFGYEIDIVVPRNLQEYVWEKYGDEAKYECKPDIRSCTLRKCETSLRSAVFNVLVDSINCDKVHRELKTFSHHPSSPLHVCIVALILTAIAWRCENDQHRRVLAGAFLFTFFIAII